MSISIVENTGLATLAVDFDAYLVEITAVTVATKDEYESAAMGLRRLKSFQAQVSDYFEPEQVATYKAHNAVTTAKAAFINRAEAVEKIVKAKMSAYLQAEQKRIRDEQALADKASAEAQAELDAANWACPITEAAPVLMSSVVVPAVTAPSKVAGIGVTQSWGYRIVAKEKIGSDYMEPNESYIAKVVKAMGPKAAAMIGGIEVFETTNISSRRG